MGWHLINYQSAHVLLTETSRWHITQTPIDDTDPNCSRFYFLAKWQPKIFQKK